MKIQQIQYENINTSFGANFVYDKKGYFRTLWEREEGVNTKTFKNYLDRFTKNNEGHKIEITELDADALNTYSKPARVKLFNHHNGEWIYYTLSGFDKYHPLRMLMKYLTSKKINESVFFTHGGTKEQYYKQLLGIK